MPISEDEEDALYQAYMVNGDFRIFSPAKNEAPSIEFPYGGKWRQCRIWEGYIDGSLVLLKEMLRNAPFANKSLVFPALFNLRHAIEVALKWHIQYAGGTLPKGNKHDLHALMEAFRSTISGLDEEIVAFWDCGIGPISELASIDPRSVNFRYATDLVGSTIEIEPVILDLGQLYFTISNLSIWLDELSNQIDRAQFDKDGAL